MRTGSPKSVGVGGGKKSEERKKEEKRFLEAARAAREEENLVGRERGLTAGVSERCFAKKKWDYEDYKRAHYKNWIIPGSR